MYIATDRGSVPFVRFAAVFLGPRLWKIIIIDRFYIALFSALKQTHCACMWFYMSE